LLGISASLNIYCCIRRDTWKSDMFRGIDTFGYVEHIMLRRIIDPII